MAIYHFKSFYKDGKVKRFDYRLEGKTCPLCHGKGEITTSGDLHQSSGTIPCPLRQFQGHGIPTCNDGILKFREYDKKHEAKLKEDINNSELKNPKETLQEMTEAMRKKDARILNEAKNLQTSDPLNFSKRNKSFAEVLLQIHEENQIIFKLLLEINKKL